MNLPDPRALAATALGLPADARVDAYAGATLTGGELRLRFASGESVPATVTVPGEGVLRVRIGAPRPSPMLVLTEEAPADLCQRDGAVMARGDQINATWSGAEFGTDALSRVTTDGVMGLPGLAAGRVVRAGQPAGWVERFRLAPDAGIFGGGESFQGPQLRGRLRVLRNVETSGAVGYPLSYLNVPFLWSDAGWGVFIHTGGAVHADLGATSSEVLSLAFAGAGADLFYLRGTPEEILHRYLALTGVPGDLPEWALGVWLSRCSYVSEAQVQDVLSRAQQAACPVDVVHVDAWQAGNVLTDLACNWSPDDNRFPPGWVGRLAARGVRTSLWLNPYVPAAAPVADELAAKGLFAVDADGAPAHTPDIPGRLVLDVTRPQTLRWWRDQIHDLRGREPFAALKADFGEEVPEAARFHDGRRGADLRNEYALHYQAATHDALRTPDGADPVLFCRSGTAGSQRYPCHWVGDSAATWDGMVTALRGCLSLALSGFAWIAHDVGGFWTTGSGDAHVRGLARVDPDLAEPDVDPELYVRWAQWGALSPVMRFHGTGVREPFGYDDPAGALAVHATQVRQALRPYLRLVAARVRADGLPAMRPMALAYPDHREARSALQYLLGPDLLVAPVLRPGGAVQVWLPPGRWRAFLGTTEVEGPRWLTTTCYLSQFPAFVRIANDAPPWYQAFLSLAPVPPSPPTKDQE